MPYDEKKLGGGLNQKATPDMIGDDELQECIGCRFDTLGAVASERGRKLDFTLDERIRGMHTSYKSGDKQQIIKAGTTLYEDEVSIGTFAGTRYLTGITFRGEDYLVDGQNQAVWDGTTLLTKIGLDGPTTPLTLTKVATGGALIDGVYEVVYTWVRKRTADDSLAVETNFSPVDVDGAGGKGVVTLDAGSAVQSIAVTAFGTAPTGATHIRLYRTLPDKKNYFFDQEIDITETTATITNLVPDTKGDEATAEATLVAEDISDEPRPTPTLAQSRYIPFHLRDDADELFPDSKKKKGHDDAPPQIIQTNLGILADWTDHDPAPDGLEHLVMANRQLFGIVGNTIHFSRVGEPEHWPLFSSFTIGRDTGETLRTILPLNGAIIAYTDANIYKVDVIGLSYSDIRVTDMGSPVGICGDWAVVDLNVGGRQVHLFMAKNGLYLFDGNQVLEIGFKVEGIFNGEDVSDALAQSQATLVRAASARDKAWFSYPSESDNDRTLLVDFQSPDDPKFSVTRYGYTTLYREQENGKIIGGDVDGNVYLVDKGDSDGGTAIEWAVRTKDFPLGASNAMIALESIVVDADLGIGTTFVNAVMDNGRNAATILTSSGEGRTRRVIEVPNYMKGNRVSVRLESTQTFPRAAYGVGFSYRQQGAPTA